MEWQFHKGPRIVSRPQPKAYGGVKYSEAQKASDLHGEARLLPKTKYRPMVGQFPLEECIRVQFPLLITKSESLLPSELESALMADRKESAHLEARKAKDVGIKVVQFRGLAASLRSKMSREESDVRIG